MRKKLLEILVCPIDRHAPLELVATSARDDVVVEGALVCSRCRRYYPIIEEIPIMLPDDLRDRKLDLEFLRRNREGLPREVTQSGVPHHL